MHVHGFGAPRERLRECRFMVPGAKRLRECIFTSSWGLGRLEVEGGGLKECGFKSCRAQGWAERMQI